jgi:hypothetical protein
VRAGASPWRRRGPRGRGGKAEARVPSLGVGVCCYIAVSEQWAPARSAWLPRRNHRWRPLAPNGPNGPNGSRARGLQPLTPSRPGVHGAGAVARPCSGGLSGLRGQVRPFAGGGRPPSHAPHSRPPCMRSLRTPLVKLRGPSEATGRALASAALRNSVAIERERRACLPMRPSVPSHPRLQHSGKSGEHGAWRLREGSRRALPRPRRRPAR